MQFGLAQSQVILVHIVQHGFRLGCLVVRSSRAVIGIQLGEIQVQFTEAFQGFTVRAEGGIHLFSQGAEIQGKFAVFAHGAVGIHRGSRPCSGHAGGKQRIGLVQIPPHGLDMLPGLGIFLVLAAIDHFFRKCVELILLLGGVINLQHLVLDRGAVIAGFHGLPQDFFSLLIAAVGDVYIRLGNRIDFGRIFLQALEFLRGILAEERCVADIAGGHVIRHRIRKTGLFFHQDALLIHGFPCAGGGHRRHRFLLPASAQQQRQKGKQQCAGCASRDHHVVTRPGDRIFRDGRLGSRSRRRSLFLSQWFGFSFSRRLFRYGRFRFDRLFYRRLDLFGRHPGSGPGFTHLLSHKGLFRNFAFGNGDLGFHFPGCSLRCRLCFTGHVLDYGFGLSFGFFDFGKHTFRGGFRLIDLAHAFLQTSQFFILELQQALGIIQLLAQFLHLAAHQGSFLPCGFRLFLQDQHLLAQIRATLLHFQVGYSLAGFGVSLGLDGAGNLELNFLFRGNRFPFHRQFGGTGSLCCRGGTPRGRLLECRNRFTASDGDFFSGRNLEHLPLLQQVDVVVEKCPWIGLVQGHHHLVDGNALRAQIVSNFPQGFIGGHGTVFPIGSSTLGTAGCPDDGAFR